MFHVLSFCGRWDARFFEKEPEPQKTGPDAERQKLATRAAVQARANVRLARKYDRLARNTRGHRLTKDQESLVKRLKDGSLEREAKTLTLKSGHGQFKRNDGTFINIGGSTGGFTRAVLYNWEPPNLDNEF